MRTLFLHIGHGKTGSSYLQSAFVKNRAAMARLGLTYPEDPSDSRALAGGITIGNGRPLIRAMESRWRAAMLAPRLRRAPGHVLYSSEFLFGALGQEGALARLRELARRSGFERIEILIFIRDPLDHLPSFYQQKVKREGFRGGIARLSRIYRVPARVAALLRGADDAEEIGVTVRNYSRRRSALLAVAADWAGLPEGALAAPGKAVVNRSLTRAELNAQRIINARFGPSGRIAADRFCEELPDIAAEHVELTRRPARRMIRRLAADIRYVNRVVPPEERYRADFNALPLKQRRRAAPTLNAAQVRVLIEGLTGEMRRSPFAVWRRLIRR